MTVVQQLQQKLENLSISDLGVLVRYKRLARALLISVVGDYMKKLTIIIALTLLAACSPKKSGVKANVGATTAATIAGVTTGTQCVGTNSSVNTGYIYDSTSNSYDFENRVKALLSATVNPAEVGTISAQANGTGVGFTGLVKLDSNGNVIGAQSKLTITVYDSIWYMNQTEANLINLRFDPSTGSALSGQFNIQTGDGFLSLKDQFGEVRFEGKIDAQNFSGTIKFQNSATVIGGSPASGTLGQFQIQRCAIFQ